MKTSHTAGPWTAHGCAVYAGEFPLATTFVESRNADDSDFPTNTDLANATLIAAAPELLEALERSLKWLESLRSDQPDDFDCSALDGAIAQARAAIAKAKGQE